MNCDITGDFLGENPVKFQSRDLKHIHYLVVFSQICIFLDKSICNKNTYEFTEEKN